MTQHLFVPRPDPHEPQFPGAARLANAAGDRKPLVFLSTFPFLKFYFNDLNDHIRVKNPLFKPFVWLSGLFFILCEATLELFAVIIKWVSEVKRDACSVSSSLHTSVMTLLSSLSLTFSLSPLCVRAVLVCMLEDSSTIPSFSVTRQQGVASPNRDRFSGANADPQRKSDCFMCSLKSDIHTALVPRYTIWIKKLTIKSSQL